MKKIDSIFIVHKIPSMIDEKKIKPFDQLSNLVDTSNFVKVESTVFELLSFLQLKHELVEKFKILFYDIKNLYEGKYPGYRSCDTEYHDFRHIMDVLVASLRLADAVKLNDEFISDNGIFIIAVSALFHDTGYIPEIDDPNECGAVYTSCHVERSIDFLKKYMEKNNYDKTITEQISQAILSTELKVNLHEMNYLSNETKLVSMILGTGDLLGQMADRIYLEKLLFLYREFKAGNIPGFDSEDQMLRKTVDFYRQMELRLSNDLEGIDKLMIIHFRHRHNINSNLYHIGMNNNIIYLNHILEKHSGNHRDYLRRDNLVSKL